jgi:choline dehydrogenase
MSDAVTFDYVIVGAGSAGCVLANRLSGLPQAPSVCLIERGPANTDSRWNVSIAAGYSFNIFCEHQRDLWLQYHSEPEKELNGRRIVCRRGIGWGGSSAINCMQFTRGQPHDFDRWAKDEYCSELWSYEKCLPYFKRLESYSAGIDLDDSIDPEADSKCLQTLSESRGFDGPMKITSGRLVNRKLSKCPYYPAFIRAGIQAGHRYNPNQNGHNQEGIGWFDANIGGGFRQSTSRCYLLPALSRKNLTVISDALVTRVIFNDKQATGVEFIYADCETGEKQIVKANKEVLLCGGAYNSPQLLMLSGIGDPVALRNVGIQPLHELPGVGRNMRDHLQLCTVQHATRHPELSFSPGDWQSDWVNRMLAKWEVTKDGWGATNNFEAINFFKSSDRQKTSNMQGVIAPSIFDPTCKLRLSAGITFGLVNQRPLSVGRLKLRSKNPGDNPVIEHNYFSCPEEVREFVDALQIGRKLLSQPALAEYIGEELSPGPKVTSDAMLEQVVRTSATSCFHTCGTCRMGNPDAAPTPEAARQLVVDAELRVCGLKGLRVVDASVMPSITSGNIFAPVLMIAERAADFIASAHY